MGDLKSWQMLLQKLSYYFWEHVEDGGPRGKKKLQECPSFQKEILLKKGEKQDKTLIYQFANAKQTSLSWAANLARRRQIQGHGQPPASDRLCEQSQGDEWLHWGLSGLWLQVDRSNASSKNWAPEIWQVSPTTGAETHTTLWSGVNVTLFQLTILCILVRALFQSWAQFLQWLYLQPPLRLEKGNHHWSKTERGPYLLILTTAMNTAPSFKIQYSVYPICSGADWMFVSWPPVEGIRRQGPWEVIRISVLMKGTQVAFSPSFLHSKKTSLQPRRGLLSEPTHTGAMILDF